MIKIDRSFITDTTLPDHDHRLVAGIIALANALNITVTAEGVEHPEQATHLHQMGCLSAQGWLYSKALPVETSPPSWTGRDRGHVYTSRQPSNPAPGAECRECGKNFSIQSLLPAKSKSQTVPMFGVGVIFGP
jgi:predicted signal transduction protein with EAL and GGDEF domain